MTNYFKLFELINTAAISSSSINEDGTFIFVDKNKANILKKECKENNIGYDVASSNTELTFEVGEVKIFKNFNSFKEQFPELIRQELKKKYYCYFSQENKRLIILENNNTCNSYFFSPEQTEFGKDITFEAKNVFYWEQIFELLRDKLADEKYNDNSFSILSYKKGKCTFVYSEYDKTFNDKDLENLFQIFKNTIEKIKLYPMIIKNRCVERIEKTNKSSLFNLITELEVICEKSELDLEIFINNIDFDSYISKYNEKINELILQTRGIIEKILSTIFTLPLTYAGSIFAFDKLQDNSFSILIFVSMSVYTLLSCIFLIYEFIDTFSLKKILTKEIKYFTNNSKLLLQNSSNDMNSINNRLLGIRIFSTILILIFIGLIIWLGISFFPR